jgi:hypothetical protein
MWLPVAAISVSAYATTYYNVDQAQQAVFPGAKFTPANLRLTDAQIREVERVAGTPMRHPDLKAWKVSGGGWFFIDEVIGKHELVTYALGLNPDGSVHQIEIMDYRESYGYEIRNPPWRQQFVGKTAVDPVHLNQDIRNISGATLSCRHVTEGVKRMLAAYVVALK